MYTNNCSSGFKITNDQIKILYCLSLFDWQFLITTFGIFKLFSIPAIYKQYGLDLSNYL
jgi:hypothetical protein